MERDSTHNTPARMGLDWVDRTGNTPQWTITDNRTGWTVTVVSLANAEDTPEQGRYVGVWKISDTTGSTVVSGSTLYDVFSVPGSIYRYNPSETPWVVINATDATELVNTALWFSAVYADKKQGYVRYTRGAV